MRVTHKQIRRDAQRFHEVEIRILTPDLEEADKFMAMKGDEIEIRNKTHKRSLDANAYMWRLCDEIAKKVQSTRTDIYKLAVQQVGKFEYLMMHNEAVERFIEVWELKGTGWFANVHHAADVPGCTVVQAFYGSSSYETDEMSRLIDYIVQEAKELGIETMPEDEMKRLIGLWNDR